MASNDSRDGADGTPEVVRLRKAIRRALEMADEGKTESALNLLRSIDAEKRPNHEAELGNPVGEKAYRKLGKLLGEGGTE